MRFLQYGNLFMNTNNIGNDSKNIDLAFAITRPERINSLFVIVTS